MPKLWLKRNEFPGRMPFTLFLSARAKISTDAFCLQDLSYLRPARLASASTTALQRALGPPDGCGPTRRGWWARSLDLQRPGSDLTWCARCPTSYQPEALLAAQYGQWRSLRNAAPCAGLPLSSVTAFVAQACR
jgi:hypothetical protein